jgi:signal transduction histidine kinase
VKQLVDMHGGEIFVESDRGSGSTFIIQLPILADSGRREIHLPLE